MLAFLLRYLLDMSNAAATKNESFVLQHYSLTYGRTTTTMPCSGLSEAKQMAQDWASDTDQAVILRLPGGQVWAIFQP